MENLAESKAEKSSQVDLV